MILRGCGFFLRNAVVSGGEFSWTRNGSGRDYEEEFYLVLEV